MKSVFVLLALVSVIYCEEAKIFTMNDYFEGSWIVSRRTLNLINGNVIDEEKLTQYNMTKTGENEYDFFPLEHNAFHRSKEAEQIVISTLSPYEVSVQKYDVAKDGFNPFVTVKFITLIPDHSYYASGVNPMNEKEEYEITTMSSNHMIMKLINREAQTVVVYSATRVIIPPAPTFFQKYGMSIMMAVMILVQMGGRMLFSNNTPEAEEKPKTD